MTAPVEISEIRFWRNCVEQLHRLGSARALHALFVPKPGGNTDDD